MRADAAHWCTFTVLFITINAESERAILNIIDLVVKEGRYNPELAKNIGVSHTLIRRQLVEEQLGPAGGHMLTREWKRACGLPSFRLDQAGGGDLGVAGKLSKIKELIETKERVDAELALLLGACPGNGLGIKRSEF